MECSSLGQGRRSDQNLESAEEKVIAAISYASYYKLENQCDQYNIIIGVFITPRSERSSDCSWTGYKKLYLQFQKSIPTVTGIK